MSLKTLLIEIEEEAVEAVEHLGGVIVHFVISEVQKLVAQAKETDLGTRAMNLVSELTSEAISGPEKMAKLVGMLVDDAGAFLAGGGVDGAVVEVENFVREFAQSAYNDFVAATKEF